MPPIVARFHPEVPTPEAIALGLPRYGDDTSVARHRDASAWTLTGNAADARVMTSGLQLVGRSATGWWPQEGLVLEDPERGVMGATRTPRRCWHRVGSRAP